MKLARILSWLDRTLKPQAFHDVSLNGLQLPRTGDEITKVAFAVDGSVASVRAAAAAGAQLLVVHHGILWRGHVRPLPEAARRVKAAAAEADVALYAMHLPLDANRHYGNNWELARYLKLQRLRPAFSYHDNVIGVTGYNAHGKKIGVCSGGAGAFAYDAQRLGCDLYVTGEADWGEKIAAENLGMPMLCAGHYATETFGVKALARAMRRALRIATVFVTLLVGLRVVAAESEMAFGLEAVPTVLLPEGGARSQVGLALRATAEFAEAYALEAEAAAFERRAGLALRGRCFWRAWEEYDLLFGFSRFDPFFTGGAKGFFHDAVFGPSVGLGAFWYLTDVWALRADADATLGLDGDIEMLYTVSAGVNLSF